MSAEKKAPSRPRKKASPRSPARRGPSKPRYPQIGLRKARAICKFAAKHLVHVDGELPPAGVAFEPIEFAKFQIDNIINPVFATVDKDGRRRIKKLLIGLPRDGAKSETAAALVLAIAFLEPRYQGQYYFIARDKKQARAVFDKVRTMVLHDPILRRACEVQKDTVIIKETQAIFQVLPGDEKSVQGLHANVCVVDEYHVHKNDSILNAMASGMIGNWDSGGLLIVLSTAGPVRKGPLWELLTKWKKDKSAHIYWCGADDDDDMDDPKVWRKANPMPWISIAALKEAHDSLPPWEFERYHLNRFPSSGKLRAFNAKAWDLLSDMPVIDPERPSMLAADASFSRDSTAFVLDQVDEDGIHNYLAWIIYPEEPGVPIPRGLIMATAIEILSTYYVERMICDPNYYVLEMMELANRHGIPVEAFRQTSEKMARAYDAAWAVVSHERARHGGSSTGSSKQLREQILNAGQEPTAYGPRLTKLEESLKIDAAVALSMVTFVAETEYQAYAGSGAFAA